jgi:cytochrome P450 family 4 subfamily V
LVSSSKNTEKSFFYNFLHPWFGTGLLTSYGEKWQARRRLITPTFHFEILNDFLQIMNEQAEIFTNLLETEMSKGSNKNLLEVNIFKKFCLCTLDIICGKYLYN